MKLAEIQKLRIDLISGEESALNILMDRDGKMSRQGSGHLPAESFTLSAETDGAVFQQLISLLDDKVFDYAGVYDHPEKLGTPVVVSVAFQDDKADSRFFEFRFGTENQDVGELLPYFDQFIGQALQLTEDWYREGQEQQNRASPTANSPESS